MPTRAVRGCGGHRSEHPQLRGLDAAHAAFAVRWLAALLLRVGTAAASASPDAATNAKPGQVTHHASRITYPYCPATR